MSNQAIQTNAVNRASGWQAPLGEALQLAALAIIAGGMLALGPFTARTVFTNLPRDMAAPVMILIFRQYNIALLAALGALWVGEGLKRFSGAVTPSWQNRLRMLLLVLLSGGLIYSTQVLTPQIAEMGLSGAHRVPPHLADTVEKRFDDIHHRSQNLYKAECLVAFLLLLLSPFAARRRSANLQPR